MDDCFRLTTAALGSALALTLLLPSAASASTDATEATTCAVDAPTATAKKKKGLGLGGLLSAAKGAGVGNMLDAGALGDSKAAEIAGAVVGTAIESGDAASAVTDVAGSGRTAQAAGAAAGAAVGVATELARQAPAGCAEAN